MKTLDEVIKGFVCCQEINCAECPYANRDNTDVVHCNDTDKEDDALHYLLEYREMVTNCNQLRTGIWIPVESPTVNGRCSECGYESHLYENDVYGEHYCPNCGAWLRLT